MAETIAKYRVLGRLGRGGMGEVYRALQLELDREVALKVLAQASPDAAGVARFLREAKAQGRFDHPNLVRLFDAGETGGRLYYAMELLDAETLAARLKREGRAHPAFAAKLARQVASAFLHYHPMGLVHRDLKPSNLMICRDPAATVKLVDFGVAYEAGGARLTRTRAVVGTPRYLSPELARGEEPTGASDVYQLGLVLFQMLTGEILGASATLPIPILVARRAAGERVPDLRALRPALPAGVGELVAACLRTVPAERIPAAELEAAAARLERELTGFAPERDPCVPLEATPSPAPAPGAGAGTGAGAGATPVVRDRAALDGARLGSASGPASDGARIPPSAGISGGGLGISALGRTPAPRDSWSGGLISLALAVLVGGAAWALLATRPGDGADPARGRSALPDPAARLVEVLDPAGYDWPGLVTELDDLRMEAHPLTGPAWEARAIVARSLGRTGLPDDGERLREAIARALASSLPWERRRVLLDAVAHLSLLDRVWELQRRPALLSALAGLDGLLVERPRPGLACPPAVEVVYPVPTATNVLLPFNYTATSRERLAEFARTIFSGQREPGTQLQGRLEVPAGEVVEAEVGVETYSQYPFLAVELRLGSGGPVLYLAPRPEGEALPIQNELVALELAAGKSDDEIFPARQLWCRVPPELVPPGPMTFRLRVLALQRLSVFPVLMARVMLRVRGPGGP